MLNYIQNIDFRYKFFLVIIGLTGTGIILFATSNYGAGISPDSVGYIATARNFAHGFGFIDHNDLPLVVQPPLYPAILGIIDLVFGIDPLYSANIINAVFLGLILFLSGLFFFQNLSDPFLALIGTMSLLVSIYLHTVSLYAWSEIPFIFFIHLYFIFISNYLANRNIKSLTPLSLSVALACITRYVGIVLIFTVIISVLIAQKGALKIKLFHASIFAFISIMPISFWIWRNYYLTGTIFGPRDPSGYSLYENIYYAFNTILGWYFPSQIINGYVNLFVSILMIVFFVALGLFLKNNKFGLIKKPNSFVAASFVVISYVVFLIVTSSVVHYDRIDNRLLSPIAMPTTFLLLYFIDLLSRFVKQSRNRSQYSVRLIKLSIIAGIILCFLIHPASVIYVLDKNHFLYGSGYSARSWKFSQTIQYIREKKNIFDDCTIYSNDAEVFYFYFMRNVKLIPIKKGTDFVAYLQSLKGVFPQENKACIVWFNQMAWKTFFFTPNELMSITNLEQVIYLNDGTIYFISKLPPYYDEIDLKRVRSTGNWEWRPRAAEDVDYLFANTPGASLFFEVDGGSTLAITALCHDWSGKISVKVGEVVHLINLYSPDFHPQCVYNFAVPGKKTERVPVVIKVEAEHDPASHSTEVFINRILVLENSLIP